MIDMFCGVEWGYSPLHVYIYGPVRQKKGTSRVCKKDLTTKICIK